MRKGEVERVPNSVICLTQNHLYLSVVWSSVTLRMDTKRHVFKTS